MNRERESSAVRHLEDVPCGGGSARKKRAPGPRGAAACSGALLLLLVGACSRDWDMYDPRGGPGPTGTASTGGAGGSGGVGGAGGATGTGGALMCQPGATVPCYGAPDGTANVGPCKKGTATCAPSGTSYGACEGEVVPIAEICASAEDDDCDGAVNDHCALWSKQFGAALAQRGFGVAVDGAGNVIVAGHTADSVDFGGGKITSAGGTDAFVAKFDSAGKHLWSKVFGSTLADGANAVAVDGMGNVIVAGFYGGAMTIDAASIPAPADMQDAFVVKLGPGGAFVWSKQFRSALETYSTAVAADGAGNVAVAGAFKGAMNYPIAATPADAYLDGFLVRLDAAGTVQWAKAFGSTDDDEGLALAMDAQGNTFITGYFDEKINFGGGDHLDDAEDDVYVAKLDPLGKEIYVSVFPSPANEHAQAIAIDADGSAVVTGYHDKGEMFDTTFGGNPLPNPTGLNVFVLKLDPGGKHVWSKTYGDAAIQSGRGVAIDAAGDVYFTGKMRGLVNFGGVPLTGGASDDVFVAKLLGSDGGHAWSRRFGDGSEQSPRAMALSKAGELYVTGEFAGIIDFGSGALDNVSVEDGFLVKLAP